MSTDAQAEPIRKHLLVASIEFWHATGRQVLRHQYVDDLAVLVDRSIGCLRDRNRSNGYTGSTSSVSIRGTRSRPRRQESSATCAERRTSGGCHARSATVAIVEVARPRISPSWPSALRRAWRIVVGWSAR